MEQQAMLLLGALVLEILSVRLPGWGVYSAAHVPLLAAALIPGNLAPACLGGVLTLAIRALRSGWQQAAPEAAAYGAALLTAWLLLPLHLPGAAVASATVYWLLVGALTRRLAGPRLGSQKLAWLRMFGLVQEIRGLGVLFSVGLALAAPDWRYLALLWLPLVISHRAVSYGIFRLQSGEANRALEEMDQLQARLNQAHRDQHSSHGQLVSSQEQRNLLEEMTRLLSQETQLLAAARHLFGLLRRTGRYATLALLSKDGSGCWTPLACESPLAARLEHHRLLNFREPWWDEAMGTRSAQILREDGMDRIFAGEAAALAIPVGAYLLYLGRPSPFLTEQECLWACWVADRAAPLLQAIGQRQSEQQALLQTRVETQQLQGQLSVLSGLLDAAGVLASSIDYHGMGELVEQACSKVFPDASGSLWLRPEAPQQRWGPDPPSPDNFARLEQVVRSQRPWFHQGLIIHPLGCFRGALMLQFRSPVEDRQCLEQVGLLSHNVGLALSNAQHLLQVVEAQAQLVQTTKLAAVAQLAAGVAHELNSPLGAIALSLSSLDGQITNEKTLRRLDLAARSAERCRSIVQRLFVFTRLGAAPQECLMLEQVVGDTLIQLRNLGAEMDFQVGQSARVAGQAQDLQELLTNLLINGLEAYPEETARKWLEIRLVCQPGLAVLTLRDGGIGMAPEVLERAFEPFFTTKVIGKNVGLGLSVAREIARQHQGEIVLESQPGQGSLVSLHLPLA